MDEYHLIMRFDWKHQWTIMPSVMKQALNVLARCVVMTLAVWYETTHIHGLAEFV